MELFSMRNNICPEKTIQLKNMDTALRNRLYNVFIELYDNSNSFFKSSMLYMLDKLGYPKKPALTTASLNHQIFSTLKSIFENNEWFKIYDFIEIFLLRVQVECGECKEENGDGYCKNCSVSLKFFTSKINNILLDEKSAYRIVNKMIVPITNNHELSLLNETMNTGFESVNRHIEKAFKLYSDRQSPDYENSIKESISAVEAMCCIITGLTGRQATLGNALKKLKDNGITIHLNLESAFSSLYSYTSGENGIRHGGIDFKNAPAEDAKYMLLSCSAFISYLIEKYSKVNI